MEAKGTKGVASNPALTLQKARSHDGAEESYFAVSTSNKRLKMRNPHDQSQSDEETINGTNDAVLVKPSLIMTNIQQDNHKKSLTGELSTSRLRQSKSPMFLEIHKRV